MKSVSTTCLQSMVLIAGLCCTAMALSAQTIVGGGSAEKRVHLILGTDPQFDTLVRQHFPDVAASSRYQSMKATSVIVANDTPFRASAIVLKWFVMQADGTENVLYSCICPEPVGRVVLPGRLSALLPSHIALVSPLGHTEDGEIAGHPINPSALESAYANASLTPAILGARTLTVKIDAIIFANDTVIGPDTFGLRDKFACERNGAIEEARSLAPLVDNPDALTQQLNRDAAARDSTSLGACTTSRAREARRLLDVREARGTEASVSAIHQLATARTVSLVRIVKR